MTVVEARAVLHKVANSLKAAKLLEEALDVVARMEQMVEQKEKERDVLNDLIDKIHEDFKPIKKEMEKQIKKRDASLVKTEEVLNEHRIKIKSSEDKMKEIEEVTAKRSGGLEKDHLDRMKDLNKKIEDKEKALMIVETKIQTAENALEVIREKLS